MPTRVGESRRRTVRTNGVEFNNPDNEARRWAATGGDEVLDRHQRPRVTFNRQESRLTGVA